MDQASRSSSPSSSSSSSSSSSGSVDEEEYLEICTSDESECGDFMPLDMETSLSASELEQVQLWTKQRRALFEIGKLEEELGLHVYGCARALNRLTNLNHEVHLLKEKQAQLSNGASQLRGLDYMHTMQELTTRDTTHNADYSLEQSSTSSAGYFFRRVGTLFYGEPSFTSSSFQSGWNSILRAARRG